MNGCPQPGSGGVHSRTYYDEDRVCSWCDERRTGGDEYGILAAYSAMVRREEERWRKYLETPLWS